MPHLWEKNPAILVVTEVELVPDWYPSYDALAKQIKRYEKKSYGIKKVQCGGHGRQLLVDFDSLHRDAQLALGDPRKHSHIMERWYSTDGAAVRFFTEHEVPETGTGLEPDKQGEYITNASVLQACRQFWNAHVAELHGKGKKAKKQYAFLVNEAITFQDTLRAKHQVSHTLPSSERRFRETYDKFFTKEGCNYLALISGNIANNNARKLTHEISALLDCMFAKAGTKPTKLKVAQRYQTFKEGLTTVENTNTGEQYNPEEFATLGDRTITKWLSTYKSKMATYPNRSDDKVKLRGQLVPHHERSAPLYAGSIISIDDRQPPFEYEKGKRLWLYNCVDVASDAVTVTVWGESKEGILPEFYRKMLRCYTAWGVRLPAELEAEMSLNSTHKETFLKEGAMFQYVRLEANNPQAKIIERRNRDFRLIHEREMQGWIGRWHARDEANQKQQGDNRYDERKYTPYQQLVAQSAQVIEDWNNAPHPRRPEVTRWQYFLQMQNPQLHPTNWRAILPHLGYRTPSSCRRGKIQLQEGSHMIGMAGAPLIGTDLIKKLEMLEGQNVTLYWLDGLDGNVMKALVYLGDTYICEAVPTPKYNHARIERTAQEEANRELQSSYTSTVDAYMKARKNSLDSLIITEQKPVITGERFTMPGLNYTAAMDTFQPKQEAYIIDQRNEDDEDVVQEVRKKVDVLNDF